MWLGAFQCTYGQLGGLATDEGKPVAFQPGVTSEACKYLCDNNERCESMTLCDTQTPEIKSCFLKDKKILSPSSEPIDEGRATCVTIYKKNCKQGIILCFIATK